MSGKRDSSVTTSRGGSDGFSPEPVPEFLRERPAGHGVHQSVFGGTLTLNTFVNTAHTTARNLTASCTASSKRTGVYVDGRRHPTRNGIPAGYERHGEPQR